ncbi:MAG: lipid asymmetry maintenance protein MlaB [Gammaproteobacteria bacterium]
MRRDGKRLLLEGAVTMDTVPALLTQGRAALAEGVDVLDFGEASTIDSAAIAMALELRRASGGRLQMVNLPEGALNLARLYSVSDQLGIEG